MKNKASVWCYISAVVSYIAGIVYCCSLLFLPIAIYCIIYGNRYIQAAKLTNSQFAMAKPALLVPTIVITIFAFPIGLITLVPYFMAGSNNVKISEGSQPNTPPVGETVKADVDMVTIQSDDTNNSQDLTSEELEKLEKLASFRNQGLLTDDEYNQAKDQIINKK